MLRSVTLHSSSCARSARNSAVCRKLVVPVRAVLHQNDEEKPRHSPRNKLSALLTTLAVGAVPLLLSISAKADEVPVTVVENPDSWLNSVVALSLLITGISLVTSFFLRFNNKGPVKAEGKEAHSEKSPLMDIERASVRTIVDPNAADPTPRVRDARLQALAASAAHAVADVARKARKEAQAKLEGTAPPPAAPPSQTAASTHIGGGASHHDHPTAPQPPRDMDSGLMKQFLDVWVEEIAMQAALKEVKEITSLYHKWEHVEKMHH